MKETARSIYEIISENIVNGELPVHFHLPEKESDNKVRFASGAMDGIAFYHMGHADMSENSTSKLNELMHAVTDGNFELAEEKLSDFAKDNTPLNAIDDFEQFIYDNTDWIDPGNLGVFAEYCLMNADKNIVKYGMEMMELLAEPEERVKEIFRTLALSDEFTLFAVFNMRNWQNGNDEIFKAAQKVHGWGRVHAVERLEPENEVIISWLLKEGINNYILSDYSALEVYNKTDLHNMLKGELTADELDSAARIITNLFPEGPVPGISAVENADEMLLDFISQVKRHKLDLELCKTVYFIADYDFTDEITSLCKQILASDEAQKIIAEAVKEDGYDYLAEYLHQETRDQEAKG